MKKILLAAFVFTMFTSKSFGQKNFRLGAKAGANLTKISGSSFKDEFRTGYHLGGFAEIDFGKLGIQPEVLWSTSRTTRDTTFSQVYQFRDRDINLDYLTIPILLRYNVGDFITLNAGPQFGVLLNKDRSLLQNGEAAFKGGDFGMVAGLQLNLKALRIYGRYNVGLNNINDIDEQDKWQNEQLQIGLGLKF
jgi:hypothetical protein